MLAPQLTNEPSKQRTSCHRRHTLAPFLPLYSSIAPPGGSSRFNRARSRSRSRSRSHAMGKIRSLFRRHRSKPQPSHAAIPSAGDPGNLERVFNKFDSNGDGKISSAELADVLESLGGQRPSEEELGRMMREADADGDGFISLAEFVELNTSPPAAVEEDLRLAFAVFDLDRSGAISADEIARVLRGIGEGASVAQCRRMIDGVDLDGDGLISFEEFKAMMTAGGCNAQAFAAFAAAK
ncbi:probable calcium-binding protein CML10 [Musa acuminata AAA Group]|uniref:probable calcium-binding protein CML10 n=1 Tax=Musa acuminata AAA Group TaxID=214697 RepID=UPI0031E22E73